MIITINKNKHWYLAIICNPGLIQPYEINKKETREIKLKQNENDNEDLNEMKNKQKKKMMPIDQYDFEKDQYDSIDEADTDDSNDGLNNLKVKNNKLSKDKMYYY